MALSEATLASNILSVLQSQPSNFLIAGEMLSSAYAQYAIAGTFGANVIPTLTPQSSSLGTTLASSFAAETSVAAATGWSSGLSIFWVGVPVLGLVQAGTTVACPGAASLISSISTIFNSFPATQAIAASELASVLHTATLTVTANVSPPASTILPIS